MLLTVIPQGNFNKLSISSLNPLSLTVDPFSPGGPGWPISPLSPWAYMSTTFSLHGHLVSNLLQWITMERTSYFTFSPASPVSPTGPMKPTKPWNTHTQCWMDEQIDVWKKKMKVAASGFLTLSPMVPTFPGMPVSPWRDKYVTGHLFLI